MGGGGHGTLEATWGLGCRGIGGWGEEEEEEGVMGLKGNMGIRLSGYR